MGIRSGVKQDCFLTPAFSLYTVAEQWFPLDTSQKNTTDVPVKVFFPMAAKITESSVTAAGDKIAIMMAHEIIILLQ